MNFYEINDIRSYSEYKGISFSKYKKSDVKKQIIQNLINGKVENANYWCAELICAGHYGELWDIITLFVSKHIHIANPKIFLYLQNRIEIFKQIINNKEFTSELSARNDPKMRRLFAEIVTIMSISNKKTGIEPVKINKSIEFDLSLISEKLIADNTQYLDSIFLKKDPKEIFIALNEFSFSIHNKNFLNVCYWYEWIIEFENICKKKKRPCTIESRNYNILPKFKTNLVWIIWDILFDFIEKKNNPTLLNLLKSTLDIFTTNYTTASCKKRRFVIYFSFSLCTDNINLDIPVITNKQTVTNVINNIEIIYKQIKKNEVSPNTDYLYNNLQRENNIKKSLAQFEIVSSIANNGD
tara:strand:+ start:2548 stop:3609 length:1062 start_codon:yes stop_codon:yes gene_type:complete